MTEEPIKHQFINASDERRNAALERIADAVDTIAALLAAGPALKGTGPAIDPTPAAPQPDADGWIQHDGEGVPVPYGTCVDVRDRDGFVWEKATYLGTGNSAIHDIFWTWGPPNMPSNEIVAYRIHPTKGTTK